MLTEITTNQDTITNFQLYKIINACREDAGESKIRVNDFTARIADELAGDHYETFVVQNSNKTESTGIRLTPEQATLVGMRESKSVRRKVLDKIKELTRPSATPENPLIQLANAVLTAQKVIDEQLSRLALAEPKAAAFDLISNAEGEQCLRDAAKYLQVKPRQFNQFLQQQGWIFKGNNSGNWVAYQRLIDQGFLIHRRVTFTRTSGETATEWQPMVTPKGIQFLSLYPAIQEMQSK